MFWSHGVSTTSLKVESLGVVALVGARIQLPFWLSASSGTVLPMISCRQSKAGKEQQKACQTVMGACITSFCNCNNGMRALFDAIENSL